MATKAELTTGSASAATENDAHHTHLAAVILDAAMELTTPEGYLAARTETWFKNLKRDVIDVTFVPLTRCALARRSARPPAKKQRKGGIWPTSIESISRCVAAYHRAANETSPKLSRNSWGKAPPINLPMS